MVPRKGLEPFDPRSPDGPLRSKRRQEAPSVAMFRQRVGVSVGVHATVAITLDVYSHATPSMHREAAKVLDGLLAGGTA